MIKIRFKMTFRELRVLFLEILYPTLLIILSAIILGISTAHQDRVYSLSLSKVPTPQTVTYMYNPTNIDQPTADRFMDWYYNQGPFTAVASTTQFTDANLTLVLETFDQYVMENTNKNENFFSVYINDISETDTEINYDIITLLDPTQNGAAGYSLLGLLNSVYRDASRDGTATFKLGRGSFPLSKFDDNLIKIILTMITVFSFSISMGVITSSMAGNICKEREDSIKHQQIVSGGSKFSYWVSQYFIDILKFLLPCISFIVVILLFGMNIPLFWLFYIMCVISILPFTYFSTFLVKKESLARNLIRLIHIFGGGAMAPIVFGLMRGGKKLRIFGQILRWGLVWNPTFTFSNGLITILIGQIEDPDSSTYHKFGITDAGGDLLFLFIQFFFYFIMILLIENKFFINKTGRVVRNNEYQAVDDVELQGPYIQDIDVKEEEDRVANLSPQELEVRAYLLNKIYKEGGTKKHAVKDVSFGISFGECFALLGINGAGKTTTFKALTGDVDPTSGEVHIGGYDVQNRIQYSSVRKLIGYCPQFDALFTNLTVKEHLEFYAHIKGVVPRMRSTVVERQLIEMGLEQYKNTNADKLSGGNKRKLSVAMAMIGNPPIVFLDEPSTGMDPKAKRFMWNIIAKISTLRKKSAVILTTHSMEEAEALSTKLGIMVDGNFK
jgi:ATP-binding cassette subfamily A (ABC1) protein 3